MQAFSAQLTPTKGSYRSSQCWFSPLTEKVKAVLPGGRHLQLQPPLLWTHPLFHTPPPDPTPPPTRPATATPACDPTAPEKPLLFLHPGDGFELLALPAAPRCAGCALLLGSRGLGADGRRAFEEGLHGSD